MATKKLKPAPIPARETEGYAIVDKDGEIWAWSASDTKQHVIYTYEEETHESWKKTRKSGKARIIPVRITPIDAIDGRRR